MSTQPKNIVVIGAGYAGLLQQLVSLAKSRIRMSPLRW